LVVCFVICHVAAYRTGWHFSYFGNPARIITKLQNFAHQEFNKDQYKNSTRIKDLIHQKRDLFGRKNTILEHIKLESNSNLPIHYTLLMDLFSE